MWATLDNNNNRPGAENIVIQINFLNIALQACGMWALSEVLEYSWLVVLCSMRCDLNVVTVTDQNILTNIRHSHRVVEIIFSHSQKYFCVIYDYLLRKFRQPRVFIFLFAENDGNKKIWQIFLISDGPKEGETMKILTQFLTKIQHRIIQFFAAYSNPFIMRVHL